MTRDDAKQEIRSRYAEYLQPAKKKNTYICPLCGNGTGSTGDGMSEADESRAKEAIKKVDAPTVESKRDHKAD